MTVKEIASLIYDGIGTDKPELNELYKKVFMSRIKTKTELFMWIDHLVREEEDEV